MKSLPWLAWAVLLLAHQGRGTVTSCCRFDELALGGKAGGTETELETCKAPKNACCVKDKKMLGCGDQRTCTLATKKCYVDAESCDKAPKFTCPTKKGKPEECNKDCRTGEAHFCCGLLAGHKVGCLPKEDCGSFTCPLADGGTEVCVRREGDGDKHSCCGLLPGHNLGIGCLGKEDCKALKDWQKCVPGDDAPDGEPCKKCQPSYDDKKDAAEWKCDSATGPKSKPAELIHHWCVGEGGHFGKCDDSENGCCVIKAHKMGCASVNTCDFLSPEEKCDYGQANPRLPHCLVPGTFKCSGDAECQSWQHPCCILSESGNKCGTAAECQSAESPLALTQKCTPARHFDEIAEGKACDKPDGEKFKCVKGASDFADYCELGSKCCDLSGGQPRCAKEKACTDLDRDNKCLPLTNKAGRDIVCVKPNRFTCPTAEGGAVECNEKKGQDHVCCGLLEGSKVGCLGKADCEALEAWQRCVPGDGTADGEPCEKCQPSYDDESGVAVCQSKTAEGKDDIKPAELIRHWCMGTKEDAVDGSRFGRCPKEKNGCCVIKPPTDGNLKVGCESMDVCTALKVNEKCDFGQASLRSGLPGAAFCAVPGTFRCGNDEECQSHTHSCCLLDGQRCGTREECQDPDAPLPPTKTCSPMKHFELVTRGHQCYAPDNFKCVKDADYCELGYECCDRRGAKHACASKRACRKLKESEKCTPAHDLLSSGVCPRPDDRTSFRCDAKADLCPRSSKCCDLRTSPPTCKPEKFCAKLAEKDKCTTSKPHVEGAVCGSFLCPAAMAAGVQVCLRRDRDGEKHSCCGLLAGHKVGCLAEEHCAELDDWQKCVPGDKDGEPCKKCQPSYDDKKDAAEWKCDSATGPESRPAELIHHWCVGEGGHFGKCDDEKGENGCCVIRSDEVKMGCASVDTCKALRADEKCDYGQASPRLPHCVVPGTFKCSEDDDEEPCESWKHACCILSESGNKCGTAAECRSVALQAEKTCYPERHLDEIAEGLPCDRSDSEKFKCIVGTFDFSDHCEFGSTCCDLSGDQPRCAGKEACAELAEKDKCSPTKPHAAGAVCGSFTCPVADGGTEVCVRRDEGGDKHSCCGLLPGHNLGIGCLGKDDCKALKDWQKCVPGDDAPDGEPCKKCQPSYDQKTNNATWKCDSATGPNSKPAVLIHHWCMGEGGRFGKCPHDKNGCCVIVPNGAVKMGCASAATCEPLPADEKCDYGQGNPDLPHCIVPGTFKCSSAVECQSWQHPCCILNKEKGNKCGSSADCQNVDKPLAQNSTCSPARHFDEMSKKQACDTPDSERFKCESKGGIAIADFCELGSKCCDLRDENRTLCANEATCKNLTEAEKCTPPANVAELGPSFVCPRADDRAGFRCDAKPKGQEGLCPSGSRCCDRRTRRCRDAAACADETALPPGDRCTPTSAEGRLCSQPDMALAVYEAHCDRFDMDCAAETVCKDEEACYRAPDGQLEDPHFAELPLPKDFGGSFCDGKVVFVEGRLVKPTKCEKLGPVYAFLNRALAKALDGLNLVLHCDLFKMETERIRRSANETDKGSKVTLKLQAQRYEGERVKIARDLEEKVHKQLRKLNEGCPARLSLCDFGSKGYPTTSQRLTFTKLITIIFLKIFSISFVASVLFCLI